MKLQLLQNKLKHTTPIYFDTAVAGALALHVAWQSGILGSLRGLPLGVIEPFTAEVKCLLALTVFLWSSANVLGGVLCRTSSVCLLT